MTQEIQNLYNKFKAYTERAEQHEFVTLFLYDILFSSAYEDLQKNWNEEHANIFIKHISNVLTKLGIEL